MAKERVASVHYQILENAKQNVYGVQDDVLAPENIHIAATI